MLNAYNRPGGYHKTPKPDQLTAARKLRQFSEETRAKIRSARMRQRLPRKNTSIEVILQRRFEKAGLKFEMHKPLFERWQPDFIFPDCRVVVQADGDYWHSLPKTKQRDEAFNAKAIANGWYVIRFSEHQIKTNPERCFLTVLKALSNPEEVTMFPL